MTIPISGPGIGIFLQKTEYKMICTLAVSKGDIVVTDGTVDATTEVQDTVNVALPATADLDFGIFAVAMEDVAAAGTERFLFRGIFDAQTTGTPAIGVALAAADGVATLGAAGAATKVIAVALETGVATPTKVMFNGIEGFGNNNA